MHIFHLNIAISEGVGEGSELGKSQKKMLNLFFPFNRKKIFDRDFLLLDKKQTKTNLGPNYYFAPIMMIFFLYVSVHSKRKKFANLFFLEIILVKKNLSKKIVSTIFIGHFFSLP